MQTRQAVTACQAEVCYSRGVYACRPQRLAVLHTQGPVIRTEHVQQLDGESRTLVDRFTLLNLEGSEI